MGDFIDGETGLYRLYDCKDALLYIGISNNPVKRWANERNTFSWWPEVTRKAVQWYDSRDEAAEAELAAVLAEHPKHNSARFKDPRRRRWRGNHVSASPRADVVPGRVTLGPGITPQMIKNMDRIDELFPDTVIVSNDGRQRGSVENSEP